jgi:hypothetical protein
LPDSNIYAKPKPYALNSEIQDDGSRNLENGKSLSAVKKIEVNDKILTITAKQHPALENMVKQVPYSAIQNGGRRKFEIRKYPIICKSIDMFCMKFYKAVPLNKLFGINASKTPISEIPDSAAAI